MNMVQNSSPGTVQPIPKLYVRLHRRLQALSLDVLICLVPVIVYLIFIERLESSSVKEWGGFLLVAFLLLYEPILVSTRGGTLGHQWRNIRIVAQAHGGNLGFFRAFVRMIFKGLLGLISILFIPLTKKHQALHDLITGSTVQIRNATVATQTDYVLERTIPQSLQGKFIGRRIMVPAVVILFLWTVVGVLSAFVVSEECLDHEICTKFEDMLLFIVVIGGLFLSFLVVVLGWRGKLPGTWPSIKQEYRN